MLQLFIHLFKMKLIVSVDHPKDFLGNILTIDPAHSRYTNGYSFNFFSSISGSSYTISLGLLITDPFLKYTSLAFVMQSLTLSPF
jgi:hypothetical protein